jgi:Flp pilus assembly protein TadD
MRANYRRITLILWLVAGLAATATAQTGRVSGIVRDDSGDALKGATVTAENDSIGSAASITATTDDKGRFTIIGLRGGTWRFVAHAPGHSPAVGEMNVRFGAPNPGIALTLRRNGPALDAPLGRVSARDLQASLAAADALFNQQKWDESIAAYQAVMSRAPALSVINLQVAAAYRAKGDHDAAIAAYEALLAVDPTSERARVGIAAVNMDRGNTAAAESALNAALAAGKPGRDALFTLAELKQTQGDAAAAAQFFEKAAAADPSWGRPLYNLGLLALQRGETQTAASFMERVIAVDPLSPESAQAKAALAQLAR